MEGASQHLLVTPLDFSKEAIMALVVEPVEMLKGNVAASAFRNKLSDADGFQSCRCFVYTKRDHEEPIPEGILGESLFRIQIMVWTGLWRQQLGLALHPSPQRV
jgi:hypothetical protein